MNLKNLEFNELCYYPNEAYTASIKGTNTKIIVNKPGIIHGERISEIEVRIYNFKVYSKSVAYIGIHQIKQDAINTYQEFVNQYFF